MGVDVARLEQIGRKLLIAIGEDPDRPGLQDTPRRFARFWAEFINFAPGNTDVTFEAVETDQMVVVSGMRVWSLCEHHLLPFWCDVSIGYISGARVLGLSKFARIAHQFAHRPQIQERLVHQIADEVERLTESENVAVFGTGVHLCMVMRGIKTSGAMKTSVMRGAFREKPSARQEFFSMVGQG
jgi:GTP cyclohydrolase I